MYAEMDTETKIRHAIDFVARRLPIPPALKQDLGPDLTNLLENPDATSPRRLPVTHEPAPHIGT